MKHYSILGMFALSALVFACSEDAASNGGGATESIGSEGGDVTSGGIAVEIPPGALAEDTDVSINEVDDPPSAPTGFALVGPAVAFTPHGTEFQEPVTLTVPYTSTDTTLVMLRLDDEEDTSWEMVTGATFDDGEASVEVESFSVYAVAKAAAVTTDGGAPPEGMGGSGNEPEGMGGSGGNPPEGMGGSGSGNMEDAEPSCRTLCEARVPLACPNGPSDVDECTAGCVMAAAEVDTGDCMAEYEAFGTCVLAGLPDNQECSESDGEADTKDDTCPDELADFFACIGAQ